MESFWEKVDKAGPIPAHRPELGACWVWTGARTSKGYGCFGISGKTYLTHRLSFEWEYGAIPAGLDVDHLCFLKVCCRPSHLEAITNVENLQRAREFYNVPLATHCYRGHPYDKENTYVDPRGRRFCIICKREYARVWQEAELGRPLGTPNKDKTHCKRGHEFTVDNTLYSNGRRNCRACGRIRNQRN